MAIELSADETEQLVNSAALASTLLASAIAMLPEDRPLLAILLESAHAHLLSAGVPVVAAVTRAEAHAEALAALHGQ
jgi:hypothetical protein